MAEKVAKHRKQMKFCNSHLTRNIFNLYVRRFFFGLVYSSQLRNCSNRAGPISRQILVLSEHMLFTLKGKGTGNIPILYCKNLDYAYFVSLPHGVMGWLWHFLAILYHFLKLSQKPLSKNNSPHHTSTCIQYAKLADKDTKTEHGLLPIILLRLSKLLPGMPLQCNQMNCISWIRKPLSAYQFMKSNLVIKLSCKYKQFAI